MKALFLALALVATPTIELPTLGQPVGDMTNWFNDSDWTSSRAGGSVRFKVVFNKDGFPEVCTIEATSGNKEVEKLACATIKKRFRFRSSVGADGAPVSRVFIRSVSMGGPPADSIRPPALFSMTVNGYKKLNALSVVVEADKAGGLVGCSKIYGKSSDKALTAAVCQNLARLWEPLVELDATGSAIRYVRDVPIEIKHGP